MQENEFEKAIREKMDQLRLAPNDEVWNKVSEKIREDKKRRRFLFLLFSFIVLAGATGFYFLNSRNTILHPSLSEPKTSIKRNTFHQKEEFQPSQEIVLKKKDQPDKQNNGQIKGLSKDHSISKKEVDRIEKSVAASAKKEDYVLKSKPAPIAKDHFEADPTLKSTEPNKRNNQQAFVETKEPSTQLHPPNPLQGQIKQPNEKNQLKQPSTLPSDSVKFSPLDNSIKKTSSPTDTAAPLLANTKSSVKPKMLNKKNWKFGLTVFGGISDNLTGLASSGSNNFSYSNANPNSPSAGQSNGGTISKLSYNTASSYGIGVFVSKSFSGKITFCTGINYHFLSSISPAGTKINTPQTVYDASLQSSAFVNQVYSSGQSVDYKNKYQLLELPVNLLWQLNRNENKKLLLTAGVTPAYLVGSRALYASTTQNLYYETNEQFKKVLLLAQAGVQLSILQSRKFEITAGPQVQYGLNNMAKSATGTSQHLSSASFKVNVILK